MDEAVERRRVRAGHNQALFREVNEQIRQMAETFEQLTPDGVWICECLNTECAERVELTLAEYEAVREDPARFIVAPGDDHFDPVVEERVAGNERYWVVEKLGVSGKVAAEADGRSGS